MEVKVFLKTELFQQNGGEKKTVIFNKSV